MYVMYLDGVQYPVPPSKLDININGNNKSINLADGSEINILKTPGLSDISLTVTLPASKLSFATYPNGFQRPKYYLEKLESLMQNNRPFRFILNRSLPDGTPLHHTKLTVALEKYTITDDATEGFDTQVKLALKQWVNRMTGLGTIQTNPDGSLTVIPQVVRADTRSTPSTYTVKAGDTLLNIAKAFLGSDSLYSALALKNGISNPCKLAVGAVIRLDV